MNHPELKIKGGTIVGMDKLPDPVESKGADQTSAPEPKSKKSKSK